MAVNPRARRARISGSKPVASAHAPWTRTIVGVSPAICHHRFPRTGPPAPPDASASVHRLAQPTTPPWPALCCRRPRGHGYLIGPVVADRHRDGNVLGRLTHFPNEIGHRPHETWYCARPEARQSSAVRETSIRTGRPPPRLRDIDGVAYEIVILPARVRMITAASELAPVRVVTGRSCRPSH